MRVPWCGHASHHFSSLGSVFCFCVTASDSKMSVMPHVWESLARLYWAA